jgi:hypothetical protein
MELAIVISDFGDEVEKDPVAGNLTLLNAFVDAGKILIDNAAGPYIEVPDF